VSSLKAMGSLWEKSIPAINCVKSETLLILMLECFVLRIRCDDIFEGTVQRMCTMSRAAQLFYRLSKSALASDPLNCVSEDHLRLLYN